MERISINRGLKTYEVCDPDGNVLGTVSINPSDIGMAGRLAEAKANIEALSAKAEKAEANNANGLDAAMTIAEIDKSIKEQIDYIFGSKVSDVFFGGVSSLAVCDNGESVMANVLAAVTPIVEASCKAANINREQRIAKHTAKYANRSAGLAPGQQA